ncbi:MAG TPA: class I SAM-dependent methyltransferase, partial [Solirubrobacteraceae bacterium]|nr:class I SAM-dependent methyltransferase [Solirubrobacteraceae bacterium]
MSGAHSPSVAVGADAASPQAVSNARAWVRGDHLESYAHRVLTPAEVLIFVRYREQLSRRVLDLGCGAGRTLGYLVALGAETHGIDIAPAMIEHCRRAFPAANLRVGDLARLEECVDGTFDAVLATDNLLDVLGDAERRRALESIHELLVPDGLLIFSSHDLGYLDDHPGPREWETSSRAEKLRKLGERAPVELVRAIGRRRRAASNRRRLIPLEERHADYAVINDFPHDYSLLHYYI